MPVCKPMRYLYTFLLFFSTLLVAFLAGKVGASEMVQRKIVHMGVGNWWFLEMRLFPTMGDALVLPALFILLNGLYIVFRQGESERRKNFGLVYYPVALVVLVILQYRAGLASLACLTGVLCMAYGDSFAAMIGTTWGKKNLPWYMSQKTWLGFGVMFLASLIVSLLTLRSFPVALLVALVAAVLEAATPYGLDNLSVPIIVALVAGVL